MMPLSFFSFFFFNDPATTEIYTLSLHDALPISRAALSRPSASLRVGHWSSPAGSCFHHSTFLRGLWCISPASSTSNVRSEEHTSELQSQSNIVCRLLLEKKKIDDLFQLYHVTHT